MFDVYLSFLNYSCRHFFSDTGSNADPEKQWDKMEEEAGKAEAVIKADNSADTEAEKQWEKAEADMASQIQLETKEKQRLNPKRHILHKFGFVVSIMATLAAFLMGLSQILGMIFADVGVIQIVLRVYVVLFCVVVVMVELELTKFARESYILHNWWTRGLIYAFLGVIGLEEVETQVIKDIEFRGVNPAALYVKVVAWVMVFVGCFYFLLGAFCIQSRYEQQREDFAERKARAVLEASGGDEVPEQP